MVPELPTLFRPRDLVSAGISRDRLRGMLRRDEVEQVARGLYRVAEAPLSEHETLAAVCARIPHGIVCLLSALQFHEIGTQLPHQVWIAVDRKARRPRVTDLPVRLLSFPTALMQYAIETHEILGVPVRVTSPARTVVDCFRYQSIVGLDVALEALKDGLRSKRIPVAEIVRAAELAGVMETMRPYMEALSA